MNKKVPTILFLATLLCIAVYIGVFIGRVSARKITSLPDTANYIANNTVPAKPIIDLNEATVDDLLALPGMNPELAEAIIEYREQFGDYYFVSELKGIDGMTQEIYTLIKDYVMVGR